MLIWQIKNKQKFTAHYSVQGNVEKNILWESVIALKQMGRIWIGFLIIFSFPILLSIAFHPTQSPIVWLYSPTHDILDYLVNTVEHTPKVIYTSEFHSFREAILAWSLLWLGHSGWTHSFSVHLKTSFNSTAICKTFFVEAVWDYN